MDQATISFVVAVHLFAWINSAPIVPIFMIFDTWVFFKVCLENSSSIKIGQE
jgi:hypothetical protein